jgi:dipeptidyl aminopeptidase/acylaminoacyl peptidase
LLCALAALASLPTPSSAQAPRPWRATDYYRLVFVSGPQIEPGGGRIAVTVTTVVEDKDKRHSEIWMVSADGSREPLRYTSPGTDASNPVWSPDGALLAFTSRREGSDDDVWFLRTGAPGGEAFQIAGVKALPTFSPDGQWLLFSWRGEEPESLKSQSWRNRVSPAAITRGADPKRFDGRLYTTLPFKGDERGYLAPREVRRPSLLYIVPRAGGEPRALTTGDLDATAPAWAPDGRRIVFVQDSTAADELRPQPRPQLHLLTVADGAVRRLETGYTESTDPQWSPTAARSRSAAPQRPRRGEATCASCRRTADRWEPHHRVDPRCGAPQVVGRRTHHLLQRRHARERAPVRGPGGGR